MNADRQRGRTLGETLFAILVIGGIGFGVYVLVRPAPKPQQPVDGAARSLKCMTTPDGLIPIKAVIVPRSGAAIFNQANLSATTEKRLAMFESYYPLERQGAFLRVGNDPMSDQSVGWVRAADVLLWTTKEALAPNRTNPDRELLKLWHRRADVGNASAIAYKEDLDADPRPYPVLDVWKGSFQIALTWQSPDFADAGVDTAWTQPLQIPEDARFYYMTTRAELKKNFEEMNAALIDLESGKQSEHPIVALLKKNVDVTVGETIDSKQDDAGVLRRILRELRNPLKIAEKQPAEIRRDSENLRRKLGRLRSFYQNDTNWDQRGIGWLPAEDLPGN